MRKSIFLAVLLSLFAMLVSSCAETGGANAPAERFSRDDWDVCGFGLYASDEDFEDKLDMQPTPFWDAMDACGHGFQFDGGSVSFSSRWLMGPEYKRLYVNGGFAVRLTDMSAGIGLPRRLELGCTLEDVGRAFGLGEADVQGIYYGDGENAPYAVMTDPGNGTKTLTLAVPAGETDDVRFNYVCKLLFTADDSDRVTKFEYVSDRRYRVLPGLPEPEQVDAVRVYSVGEEEPERVLKLEEAIDLLACIQDAGQTPVTAAVMPTHRIEIVSGGDTYALNYGDGLIEAPDGSAYEVWDIDKEMFTKDIFYNKVFDRLTVKSDKSGQFYSFGKNQTQVQDILNSIERCEGTLPDSGSCTISGVIGDAYYKFIYYIGTEYMVYKGELYSISAEDAQKLTHIYNEIFK